MTNKNNISRRVYDEIIQTKDPVKIIRKYKNFFGEDKTIFEIIYDIEQKFNKYEYN